MGKTVNMKSREELDVMSKEEIYDFRTTYLSQSNGDETTIRRYWNELEVYILIRFREDEIARYERWATEAAKQETLDPVYHDSTILLSRIVERMGKENYYRFTLSERQKELGEMLYIKSKYNPSDFSFGDKVTHNADVYPFTVVSIEEDQIGLKGNWSGGVEIGWVKYNEIINKIEDNEDDLWKEAIGDIVNSKKAFSKGKNIEWFKKRFKLKRR